MAHRKSFWQRVGLWLFGDGKRYCRACGKQIKRGQHWRLVAHGWRRKPQHWNCLHPTQHSPFEIISVAVDSFVIADRPATQAEIEHFHTTD